MIGYYNYTVWLTYASLLSACLGIGVSLHGAGHPYWGVFFLLLSGLCDAFDGRVARRKKDRSQMEKKYGIQIDSLAEEERQNIEGGSRKTYEGLPVTSAALIFPTIMLLQYVLPMDITLVYYIGMLITGALFISRIQVVKPGFRGILIMVLFGAAEAVLLLVGLFTIAHR
ncbi:CDP-alcohol phosphatidyltransferase family protein [Eubacterium pyruvativorans]|uniref:CDP-alcohol phosphatidyltransferase family protein n=1 Tax=Eubacterium pyruvativorans TaxID=155865 RepID=UPI0013D4CAE0|nr:CDP-alcohol phosphatidyltransferase family protein [Eubacterium pyruvativorans]